VKFAFIAAEKAAFPVTVLCRTLGVSRAGFYAAQDRPPAARTQADAVLGVEVAAIHAESRACYGSPPRPRRVAGARARPQPQAGGASDAAARLGSAPAATVPGHDGLGPCPSGA